MYIEVKTIDTIKRSEIRGMMYIFYYILFTLFSLDFGYVKFKTRKANVFAKMASFSVALFLGSMCTYLIGMSSPDMTSVAWQVRFIAELYIYIIILYLIPDNKTFFSYEQKLRYVDMKLGVNTSKYRCELKILLYILFFMIYQSIMSQMYCFVGGACQPLILSLLLLIPTMSYNITHVKFLFIFYLSYMRLVELRKCIQAGNLTVRHTHFLYKLMINSIEMVLEGFKLIVSYVIFHYIIRPTL